MEIKYLKETKEDLEIELDNLTVAEILRVYLNNLDGIELAAWKREHPSKNPVLKIKTKGKDAKAVLKKAISDLEKDLDKLLSDFKKSK